MKVALKSGRLQRTLIYVRSSFWFMPTLIVVAAIALAVVLVQLDQLFGGTSPLAWARSFASQAENARSILSTIAGSMATVAGVVFSITIVALTLASSQYTSRVLRNFMRDRANQVVLGVFIGVYIYCLIVLGSISMDGTPFVPATAVLGAVALAILASGIFIFFIHHIASTIQASEMAAAITTETLAAVEMMFPEEVGHDADEEGPVTLETTKQWYPVPAHSMGYVQRVQTDALLSFARHYDTLVRMERGIGDFVAEGQVLASVALDQPPGEELIADLNGIYAIDTYRTIDQDVAFGVRQLVDIALKALSPGINDTTTAVTCLEHLAVVLGACAMRATAAPQRLEDGVLRVIARRPHFCELAPLAFDQILESAKGNTEVLHQMLLAIQEVGRVTPADVRRATLRAQVDAIEEMADRTIMGSAAKARITQQIATLRRDLQVLDVRGRTQAA